MDLDFVELGKHVQDSTELEFPGMTVNLPHFFGFQMTKYMVLELVVAGLMFAIFITLAKRMRGGGPPKGYFWNLFEVILVFLRDEIARPSIGKRDADRFLPYLWNVFFFILFCNLMGVVPWAGSPTGALTATAALAAFTFSIVVGAGVVKFGGLGYLKSLVPHMDVPTYMAVFLVPLIFVIELFGLIVRHAVLAVRLLANMFGGHLVLAVILTFIISTAKLVLFAWFGVTLASVVGSAAMTLLELFVAFMQAYVFTFLSALFIGMAVHPH